MTPLQLGALVSAISNDGTLYYLQHPTSPDEVANFQPRVKRHLDIGAVIPEISDGMAGAVQYGTARSLRVNFNEEEVLGKTGTCSRNGTRFGWFASYANTNVGRNSAPCGAYPPYSEIARPCRRRVTPKAWPMIGRDGWGEPR